MDKTQLKAAALQAAVQTLLLYPEAERENVINDNKDNAGKRIAFLPLVLGIARKYEEYLQEK
jgi:hypothetical protein